MIDYDLELRTKINLSLPKEVLVRSFYYNIRKETRTEIPVYNLSIQEPEAEGLLVRNQAELCIENAVKQNVF